MSIRVGKDADTANVLGAAPTGSGKTAIFELALLRMIKSWSTQDEMDRKVAVYLAPTKVCLDNTLTPTLNGANGDRSTGRPCVPSDTRIGKRSSSL
jgi:hypothetical protein